MTSLFQQKALIPEVFAWIEQNKGTSGFAKSLYHSSIVNNGLTDNQIMAVRRALERETKQQEQSKTVEVTALKASLDRARAHVSRPKLRIGELTLRRAEDSSSNPGAIYVVKGTAYCGKIIGRTLEVNNISEEERQLIMKALDFPRDAVVEYGRNTGKCSCCGQLLTNQQSIDLGIGPICARKFGF